MARFFFSPAFFISLFTSPSGTTCFISKEIWPDPLSCTTWTKRECKRICAERSPSYVLRHIRFPYVASLKSLNQFLVLQYPGSSVYRVPEVFLARGGNFRCWPKADTSSAVGRSHEPDGNRSKKSLWHLGGQGFESRTSLNFFWLSFATAKDCVKNAMIFFHIVQLTLFKVWKNFRGERFCRAPLGQMFNSWCISLTIYNIHSRDWRLGFTILWTIIWSFFTCNSGLLVT